MTEEELKSVYKTMIRPAVEYASSEWHSLLTIEIDNYFYALVPISIVDQSLDTL